MLNHTGYSQLDLVAVRSLSQTKAVSLLMPCKQRCTMTGTEHCVSSAYHPQTDGLTERFNQTLQTALVKLVNNKMMQKFKTLVTHNY